MNKEIEVKLRKNIGSDIEKFEKISKNAFRNDTILDIEILYKEGKKTDTIFMQNNYYELDFLKTKSKQEADKKILSNAIIYYKKYQSQFKKKFDKFSIILFLDCEFENNENYIFPGLLYCISPGRHYLNGDKVYDDINVRYINKLLDEIGILYYFHVFMIENNLYIGIKKN